MLFQNNVEEKVFREHIYRMHYLSMKSLINEEQIKCVSDCLGPPLLVESTDDGKKSNAEPETAKEETFIL